MFQHFRLTQKVWTVVLVYWFVLLAVMGAGFLGMKNSRESLAKVHDHHMDAAAALGTMRRSYLVNRMEILLMFQHAPDSPLVSVHDHPIQVHIENIAKIREENNQASKVVESKPLSTEEKNLIDEMLVKRKVWQVKRDKVMSSLGKNDFSPTLMAFFLAAGRDEGAAFEKSMTDLVTYQTKKANEASEAAEQRYTQTMWLFGIVTIFGALPMTLFMLQTLRRLSAGFSKANTVAHEIASGDLTHSIHADGKDEITDLLNEMSVMQNNLKVLLSHVLTSADSIASASSQVASGTSDLSARTEHQASALEETASASDQLNSTVKHNADNAAQANQMAEAASNVASKGGEVVGQVVHTMAEINTSSRKIVDIIAVIDGIAFQTNILALNAAVEAARAGEQGRGFAVVASEVRSLAQRASIAAKEIKSLIDASVSKVESGTQQVAEAGHTMQEIVNSIEKVTHIMRDIANSSNEQALGISQINQAVASMDSVTQQNAALVEEASSAAMALQQQAQQLKQEVQAFKL